MWIRFLTGRVSIHRVDYAGDIMEMPDEQARTLIKAGQAEATEVPENASVAPPEQAVVRTRSRPRRPATRKR